MGKLKRGLALFLSVAMIGTLLPETAFAGQGNNASQMEEDSSFLEGDAEGEKDLPRQAVEDSADEKANAAERNVNAAEGKDASEENANVAEGKDASEENAGAGEGNAEDSASLPYAAASTETFRVLTAGQELHQTKASQEFYRFQPEESGWYRLQMQSKTDCKFSAGVQQTIYYENSVEKKQDYSKSSRYKLYQNSQLEQLMWLNRDEVYEFYCIVTSYEDPDNLDVALTMKRTEISGMETAAQPTGVSNNAWIGTGMQVRIRYGDGESIVSDVDCSYTSYSENSGSSTNTLRALNWCDIAHKKEASISRDIQVLSLDGNKESLDIYRLAEGEHTAGLGVYYTALGESSYYEFQAKFQVAHNPVKSISVTEKRDSYTRKFGQSLEPVTIEAIHEDGKKETLSSYSAPVYQYLSGEETEGPGGVLYPMRYMDIDSYMDALERSGELGEGGVTKADVTVEYQGVQTTYPIAIAENPYNGISVTPKRTVYYMDASDSISVSDVGRVSLSRKDGAEADSYSSITAIPGNAYYSYGNYGLRLEGKPSFYKDINGYQKAGGTAGKKQVTVSYLDYQAAFDIDLRENPYERIEIAQNPEKTEYRYSSYSQSLKSEGLVFHAYKADGTYDVYTYGSKEGAVEGWSRYLRISADSSLWYCREGEHAITVSFMDHKAEYKIQVVKEQEPEKTVYTDLKILKAPTRTIYYMGEWDTAVNTYEDRQEGLEFELTDSKGATKKYRYGQGEGQEGYGSWWDVSWDVGFAWDEVDWSKPGTYQVQVTCQDLEAEFDVMVADSPVVSFEVVTAPQKDVYYRYEGSGMDLKGMSYQIAFDDGSIHAETIKGSNPDMAFQYQGRDYRVKKEWMKKNSSGNPTYGENGMKFTLFGKTYQIDSITVCEDPVKSIQFVKAPEQKYFRNASSNIDLYGAKFLISYADGTEYGFQVEKHSSYVQVGDAYGKTLSANVSYFMDPQTHGTQKCLQVSYMNASAELPIGPDPSQEESKAITDGGQTGLMETDEENPYRILSFAPKETGNYYLYCVGADAHASYSFQVELYEGKVYAQDIPAGGWYGPCVFWNLQKGTTYYFVVSNVAGNPDGKSLFQCYLSSAITGPAELGAVKGVEVDAKGVKDTWYEFEFRDAYAGRLDSLDVPYQVTYNNEHNWSEVHYPYMLPTPVGDKMLSAEWKYKRSETNPEDMRKPEFRDDNAILFQWGDEVLEEVPVHLKQDSPIESITIDSNPLEGRYRYQAGKGLKGLAVTVHYTKEDGRPDKKILWEDEWERPSLDGYELQSSWGMQGGEEADGSCTYRLQVEYMGVSVEEDVAILPNPILGFTLKKRPKKDSFYHFEDTGNVDLYGMEFTVDYRDGKSEAYQVKEHGSSILLSDGSGETVEGRIHQKGDGCALFLSARGCQQQVMEYKSLPLPEADAEDIKEGQTKYAVIGEGCPVKLYRLQAESESKYTFHVNSRISAAAYLYDGEGQRLDAMYLSAGDRGELSRSLGKGEDAYYVVYARDLDAIGSISCALAGEEIQKEEIPSVSLDVDAPVAGQELPQVFPPILYEGYDVDSYQWYGGEGENAAFAAAHRLKVILAPDREHCFTAATEVRVNGDAVACTLESNGTVSLYYTFPHTECKVDLPQAEGYTLHIRNEKKDRVAYGGSFAFQYLDETGEPDASLTVKANDNLVPLGEDGCYTIENVTENITVIARPKYSEVGEGESLLVLHNKSKDTYDTMVGKRNQTIKDNKLENALPALPNYAEGSDQFFYGWYRGKDEAFNGMGTRFTSMSKLAEAVYQLYAKWGSGYFTSISNGKQVQYKVMSFDEYNRMSVQVKGLAKKKAMSKSRAFGMEGVLAKPAAVSFGDEGLLAIPAALEQEEMSMEEGLNLAVSDCRVESVAESAFSGDTGLTDIVLPDTVESIGANAFLGCASLERVTLPDRITEIKEGTFSGCGSLESVAIPERVKELGENTFSGCTSLKEVTLPKGLEEVGENAFLGCESLKKITLPKSVEKLGESAFSGCTSLEEIIFTGGITQIGSYAFAKCSALKKVEIPDTVTELPEGVFQGCRDLTVVLPDTMEKIDASAFADTTGISIVCSSQLAESSVIKDLQGAQSPVQTVSFSLEGDGVFSYGEPGRIRADFRINGKTEEGRKLLWKYPETDAYDCRIEGSSLVVLPKRLTGANERFDVTVTDAELGLEASLRLRTVASDLGGVDEGGAPLYEVEIGQQEYVYTGAQYRPSVAVKKAAGQVILDASDYTVTYSNNQKAGTAQVIVSGKGNYAGTIRKSFVIAKAKQYVTARDIVWSVKEPIVQIGASSSGDGQLSYASSNEKVASVDASGIAIIHGAGTASIRIQAAETENFEKSEVKQITLTVRASQEGSKPKSQLKVLKASYTKALGSKPFSLKATAKTAITYKSSSPKVAAVSKAGKVTLKKCGKAVITVRTHDASKKVTIRIVPKRASIKKAVIPKAGSLTVSWARQKEASGYVIECSTDKKFKKNVTRRAIGKNSVTKVTLKKLKKGKRYYVRMRAYTLIGGQKAYGDYSKIVKNL